MDEPFSSTPSLFFGGPPEWVERWLGLIKPDARHTAWRAFLTMVVGWAPLAVLAFADGHLLREGDPRGSFLLDLAAYARFLIAAPLFIICEALCLPRLNQIAQHFLKAGLVLTADRARYDEAVNSTRRYLNAKWAEIGAIVLSYAIILYSVYVLPDVAAWQASALHGRRTLSLAGWWYIGVSGPLFLVLLLGWLWRVLLWGRFLWLMSRLNLKLLPSHPDLVGGLRFVGTSIGAFVPLAFAMGTTLAGPIANQVVYEGHSLLTFRYSVAVLVVVVLFLFVGPVMVFNGPLVRARRVGIFNYGALAGSLGQQFEQKWLSPDKKIDKEALQVQDFSATVDLYGVVSNVRQMKITPIDRSGLIVLALAVLLPFLPVVLTVLPLRDLLKEVATLLL